MSAPGTMPLMTGPNTLIEAIRGAVIGDDEAAAGEVGIKPLRTEGGQRRVALAELDRITLN